MLETRNLRLCYGNIRAIHNISVRVDAGEIVTLIGANGAGKSTFLKAVAGLIPIEDGEIIFEGEKINGFPGHKVAQRGLILIPEGRRIFPLLTVDENLSMGAFMRKDAPQVRRDRDHVFELFPVLLERRRQLGGTLSGGEQQMLAMGRALMSRPKLLMMDEPSMGLAPVVVDKIFKFIREINSERGLTILLVEQNAVAALAVAKRGYVLETGSVVLEDGTANLLSDDRVKMCYLGVEESTIT